MLLKKKPEAEKKQCRLQRSWTRSPQKEKKCGKESERKNQHNATGTKKERRQQGF